MTRQRAAWSVFLAVLACSVPAWTQPAGPGASPSMVVLVRHAEKAAEPADDPPLTGEGLARANALAETMRHAGVNAIITTQWRRTKETAAPLVAILQPAPKTEVVATGDTRAHAAAIAAAVRRHRGEVVLLVGHSNTVPAIIAALGGPRLPDICDSAFDDLFVLVPAGKGMRLVQARYGAPSPRQGCR